MSKLSDALTSQKKSNEQVIPQIFGSLGIPIDGQKRVEVSGRNGFVYVRLRDNQSEVIQAFNNQVSPSYNLPVIVERQGNRYIVVSVDTQRYQNNWTSFAPFLPRHGNTHSFDPENDGGGDVVWVHSRQFMPALIIPSGSSGAMNVLMSPYTLKNDDGTWKYVGNTGTASFAPYLPTGTAQATMALIYLDAQSGNPQILGSSSQFSSSITGSSQIYSYIPRITNPNTQIPLAAVRLVTGTTRLSWDNLYDVRQFLHSQPTGSAGGGLSSIAVQDEGAAQGNVTTFNFVGAGVTASVSGSVARISVNTGSSSGGSVFTGTPMSAVLTSPSGTLYTPPWLKWGTDNRQYLEFGADVAGKEVNAGKVGYEAFGSGYFDIVGAGTGSAERRVRILDHLVVTESIQSPNYDLSPGGTYNVTGSPHVHSYSSLSGALTQAAGTYTPVLTGTANVDALTTTSFVYMRLGNFVTVEGNIAVDPTLAAPTNTTVGIPLPIASNFTATADGGGIATAQATNTVGSLAADITNDRMTLTFQATSTANTGWRIMFMYEIK